VSREFASSGPAGARTTCRRQGGGNFRSALYHGELMHARHVAPRRAFAYPSYVAAIDLDELPALDRELRLFSHGGKNLFALRDRDYSAALSPTAHAPVADLGTNLADLLAGNGLPAPHTTRLITHLRTLGYVFNPVSFFLNYDATGALGSVVAEVNNTYGGSLRYVLGPGQRLPAGPASPAGVGFRHARELFVSPFLLGQLTYDFWFDAPKDGAALAIEMHVHGATGRALTARLTGTRTPLSDRALLATAVRFPFATLGVIGRIHLEAWRLRRAGEPYRRPGRDHRPLQPT
jgi:uncharacterized protein